MREPPRLEIDSPYDSLLAKHHVRGLTFIEQRAAACCALLKPDEDTARQLVISEGTVRGQVSRTQHKVLDTLVVPHNRTMLGRWAVFHWNCCMAEVATRCAEGTRFDPAG